MMFRRQSFIYVTGLFLMLSGYLSLLAQDVPAPGHVVDTIDTSADIFENPDPMEITLTLNLKQYQKEKFKGEYLPVTFQYRFNDTLTVEKTMRMKARGNFRRQYCSLPPFWLNIRKADVANVHLQGIKRIKVVTHCSGGGRTGELLLTEYLIYRIYNIISPVSFRVRLVKMRYIDTGRKNKMTESWAFMIEPEELLAERLNALVVKRDELTMKHIVPEDMDRVALFMYMIGNSDYAIRGRHNVKILGLENYGSKGYTPVPYDFDYSGLVNAPYAIPGENLGIESVRDRYYLGACRDDQAYQLAIDHLAGSREEIHDLVQEFPHLSDKIKKDIFGYLESYFSEAEGGGLIRYGLNSTCR